MTTTLQSVTRAVTLTVVAAIVALTMGACNTIGGAGRDIESVGGAIDDAAED